MEEDVLIDDVIKYIINEDTVSPSMLQKRFKIGFSRANDILTILEDKKLVSSYDGKIPRKVLKKDLYIYSASKIKEEFSFNQGTFYNRLDETGIRNKLSKEYNIEYAKKDELTGKIMFNQKAFDLLSKYKDSSKNDVNTINDSVNDNVIVLQAHKEMIELLKKQIEDKDREINNYLDIISKKDLQIDNFQEQNRNFQVLLKDKEEKINQLGTAEDNKKWWQFFKKRNNDKKEDIGLK